MYISYNQKKTNQIIYDEIKKASKYIHITTMFFNDDGLSLDFIKLLNHKVKEHPDIEIHINIGLNPFVKTNLNEYNLNKKININIIPMKIINTYHIRFFQTESIAAVGGIDITKFNLSKNYIQFSLFIPIQNNIFISKMISNKNILYDFTENKNSYNVSKIDPYTKVNQMIDSSKHHIFIDNQYFFSKKFTNKLIEKKINYPNIIIEIFTNYNYANEIFINRNDAYNTIIKNENSLMKIVNDMKVKFFYSLNQSNLISLKKNKIIIHDFYNKFTHNKIFIFDKKYIIIGSMNIMHKSLKKNGGDIELCFLVKNKKLANEMLNHYKTLIK